MSAIHPLILTLDLDRASAGRFETLRREHFPPERNFIPAHVTLFHALPGEHEAQVLDDLEAVCSQTRPFSVQFPHLRFLGRGVAADLVSPELLALRSRLASRWQDWLTRQDAQKFRPHVTIQNKVPPEQARTLFDTLAHTWEMPDGAARGLCLWRYLGGPWEQVRALSFAQSP